jgi:hypothetical protein
MFWVGLGCLNQFINSVVWNNTVIDKAPVWCDISTRLTVGINVAVPAASLCINRRLYHIASVKSVTISRAEKRRSVMIDLAIGLGLPIMEMILQYIAQGHRYDIFEDVGCFPFTYFTPVGIVIVNVFPLLIGIVAAVYCSKFITPFIFYRKLILFISSQHPGICQEPPSILRDPLWPQQLHPIALPPPHGACWHRNALHHSPLLLPSLPQHWY